MPIRRAADTWRVCLMSALLLVALATTDVARASPGVHVCNGSPTLRVMIAQAWQKGYAGNFVVSGWFELQPAPIKLFRQCSTIGAGFTSPSYVLVAHADDSGRMSVYKYAFDNYGNIAQEVSRPLCIAIDRAFTLEADNREGLSTCPAGMIKVPFHLRINAPADDSDITLYVAEPGQPAQKVGTFEELARDSARKPANVPQRIAPPVPVPPPAERPVSPPDPGKPNSPSDWGAPPADRLKPPTPRVPII